MTNKTERADILRTRYLNVMARKGKRGGHATRLLHRLGQLHERRPVTLPHVKWLDRPDQ